MAQVTVIKTLYSGDEFADTMTDEEILDVLEADWQTRFGEGTMFTVDVLIEREEGGAEWNLAGGWEEAWA